MTRSITSPAEPTLQNSDNDVTKIVHWNKISDVELVNFTNVAERLKTMGIQSPPHFMENIEKLKAAALKEIAQRGGEGNIPPTKDE